MLLSAVLSLTAESSYPILGALGRPAQAWFLQQVTSLQPEMASRLHDEHGLKPYTVSTLLDENGRPLQAGDWLKPGQTCWLRITTFEQSLSRLLENKILKRLNKRLTLYQMNFRVDGVAHNRAEHPWAGETSFADIAQQSVHLLSQDSVRIEFASPTAFRVNGLDLCLPSPEQVFRSLWAKWNAFCPETMQVQDLWPDFAAHCLFVKELTAVNTTHWLFADGNRGGATGFTGTVGYLLSPAKKLPEQWSAYYDGAATVMQSLAQFAFYSGVGHHTTIGMGQCRLIPNTQSPLPKNQLSKRLRT